MSLRPARSAETPRVLTAYEVVPLRNAAHVTVRRRSLALPGAIRIGRQWRYVRRILTDWLARPEAGTPDRGAVAAELVGGRPEMVTPQEMAGVLRVADLTVRRLVQAGELRALTLPYFERFSDYDGRLGRPLLSLVYPDWKA